MMGSLAIRSQAGGATPPHARRRCDFDSRRHGSGRGLRSAQSLPGRPEHGQFIREIADRLRTAPGKSTADLAARVLPRVVPAATGGIARLAKFETLLAGGAGNPYQGKALFTQLCGSCHTLFQNGGRLGPDLTSYQRDNLATLPPAILDPNAEIREGVKYHTVTTADGRTLGGFLLERDARVLVLRGLDGEDITLPQAEIRDVRPVGRSPMPDGLLDALDDQQVRDLMAYLRLARSI